jgi:hypothetical protein
LKEKKIGVCNRRDVGVARVAYTQLPQGLFRRDSRTAAIKSRKECDGLTIGEQGDVAAGGNELTLPVPVDGGCGLSVRQAPELNRVADARALVPRGLAQNWRADHFDEGDGVDGAEEVGGRAPVLPAVLYLGVSDAQSAVFPNLKLKMTKKRDLPKPVFADIDCSNLD